MILTLDTKTKELSIKDDDLEERTLDLYTKEAFELLSEQWMILGWNQKQIYTFTWMGRPIIQLPEDMVRTQEVIYTLKPDVIIEAGVAHGGSLIFYASLCKAMGVGRIIGIDIEIRPQNRKAIEEHELFPYITLIEGDSVGDGVINQVEGLIKEGEKVLVILDSCHTKEHVLNELNAYSRFVSKGSYIIATDGVMSYVRDTPRGTASWQWDNPTEAAKEFVANNREFIIETPQWQFNESELSENITHWPGAWVKRR